MNQRIKILGLTDLHVEKSLDIIPMRKFVEKEKIDLITIAGDLTHFGKKESVKEVLVALSQLALPVFYVPGNLDATDSITIELANIIPLHGRSMNFLGFNFIGVGGSNKTPFNTLFEMTEEELSQVLYEAKGTISRDGPIILISHPPPYNSEADKVSTGHHVGSKAIRDFVLKVQPLVILCGHIHESQSISVLGETKCVNPGPARDGNAALIILQKDEQGAFRSDIQIITITNES